MIQIFYYLLPWALYITQSVKEHTFQIFVLQLRHLDIQKENPGGTNQHLYILLCKQSRNEVRVPSIFLYLTQNWYFKPPTCVIEMPSDSCTESTLFTTWGRSSTVSNFFQSCASNSADHIKWGIMRQFTLDLLRIVCPWTSFMSVTHR